MNNIKYVHTNIIAKNWRKLAQFYIEVFDCKPLHPERDLSGEWLDKLTDISDVRIKGMHLALPGFEDGPTLEIFEYNKALAKEKETIINEFGFGHIAFHVSDVAETLNMLLSKGGTLYGPVVEKEYENLGRVKVVYARDPEGNIIEIQNWTKDYKDL